MESGEEPRCVSAGKESFDVVNAGSCAHARAVIAVAGTGVIGEARRGSCAEVSDDFGEEDMKDKWLLQKEG